jgi:hypothetical protein
MRRSRNKWPPNCFHRVRARPSRKAPLIENEVRERMSDRGTADEPTAAPVTRGSLNPEDWTGFREQAHRMLDDMLEHMETARISGLASDPGRGPGAFS